MNTELQNRLFEAFPDLFARRTLPPSETCMCWGIDTGDGWYDLIEGLCTTIYKVCEKEGIQAEQVKEKFGGLRFYTNKRDPFVDGAILLAEHFSYRICETCGAPGVLRQQGGWYVTLCDKCYG